MRKIYLAGKVTGLKRKDVEARFNEAERQLGEFGYVVINPVKLLDEWMSWEQAMRKAIKLLMSCDEIALIPGWHDSPGANIEYRLSQALRMPAVHLTDVELNNLDKWQ